jgi:hypothetical protein
MLPIHSGLADRSRLTSRIGIRSTDVSALLILLTAGALAAVSLVCFDMKLRIPGNAILRGIFPMAIGLALAPRRQGGTVMGISAVASACLLHFSGGFKLGTGSLTSLAMIGPCLDVCLGRVDSGWKLYGSFVLAGFACNLLALTVRAASKFGGWEAVTSRPFATWWYQAVGSYTACGIVAGLISAIVWFRLSTKKNADELASE